MNLSFFKKLLPALLVSCSVHGEVINVNYEWFQVQLDCDTKSAVGWQYTAIADTDNLPRHERFYHDPNVPSRCQQTSQGTYKTSGDIKYHRGHLVPANAMDSNADAIQRSNMMVNVLPQVAQMNQGAWYQTEMYVECRRDRSPVTVYGGVFHGQGAPDGDFRVSHGIVAPEAFYKIALQGNSVIAWWIPNTPEATASKVDDYIVTVTDIESWTGLEFPIAIYLKDMKASSTAAKTEDCRWN